MTSLEQTIDYKFRNSLLLAEALTHPSLAYESQRPHFDNQRLEFLGDAVLQLVLTSALYELFPYFTEGLLTKLRSRLVSRSALASYARRLDLGRYLMLGKGEESSGGRSRTSSLADCFESLVGAIYLDGSLEATRGFVLAQCAGELREVAAKPSEINPKGELQEVLQAISTSSPIYKVSSEGGPDHEKTFRVTVLWQGKELGFGKGPSKKQAEIQAAVDALEHRHWDKQGEPRGAPNAP